MILENMLREISSHGTTNAGWSHLRVESKTPNSRKWRVERKFLGVRRWKWGDVGQRAPRCGYEMGESADFPYGMGTTAKTALNAGNLLVYSRGCRHTHKVETV